MDKTDIGVSFLVLLSVLAITKNLTLLVLAAVEIVSLHENLTLVQYPSEVVGFSSQYGSGSENVISYSVLNLIGTSTIFPAYGDFFQAFSFRNYGHWQAKQPFYKLPPQCMKDSFQVLGCLYDSQDFIELIYEVKLYPTEVKIFETYNPGALNQIFAYDESSSSWVLLWRRKFKETVQLKKSRIFSPPLCHTEFKTNYFVLEFCQEDLEYFSQIDAVALVGSFFRRPIPCQPAVITNSTDSSAETASNTQNYFQQLPQEICQKIFLYFDLKTLCRAARVCRSFRDFCYDSTLYKYLNLQPYWPLVTDCALQYMNKRLDFKAHTQYVNLSWCRNISTKGFCSFIENGYPAITTCIRLACCQFLTDNSLTLLCSNFVNLKELNLSGCLKVHSEQAFEQISHLQKLGILCVSDTLISDKPLIKILRSCKYLEHLSVGSCQNISSLDDCLLNLETYSKLSTLELWHGTSLGPNGLYHLANTCLHLSDLNVGWCLGLDCETGCLQTFIGLRGLRMRRLTLTSVRSLHDNDLWLISKFCPYLEELDISGTREITQRPVEEILNNCRVLSLLDVSFSHQISTNKVQEWRHNFPQVQIKKSISSDDILFN